MIPRSLRVAASWVLLVVASVVDPFGAQGQIASTRERPGQTTVWMEAGCDTDWDGAGIGAGLGGIVGYGLASVAYDTCSDGLCVAGAILGAAAGLWAGLAIDSRYCEPAANDGGAGLHRPRDVDLVD